MALELDARQRAMLQEMGVHVWLPGADFALVTAPDAGPAAVPAASQTASRIENPPRVPAVTPMPAAAAPARASVPLPVQALAATDWAALQHAAASCQACGLCAGRRNTTLLPVSGSADWMVVGDPPDEDEDAAAHPFAGPSGVLLDNMLAALGLCRSQRADGPAGDGAAPAGAPATLAYVTNVVKCRPPHGTLVQAADLAQCAAYLQREIALVQPKMILAMGRFANQLLLGETPDLANQPLGKLRGVVRQYRGIAVVATYHPKALIRTSADKAKAWADLCLAADTLDTIRQAPV